MKKPLELGRADTPEQILSKLQVALLADGDFPVRAKVVNELRKLTNNPHTPIEQITEVILRETTLATRVLHIVNSAFYQRSVPIMTVSQAVMQIGMRPLSELFTGLVLMQKFIPNAERGGIFADMLKRSIVTSLLTSSLARSSGAQGIAETGYLAGTFFSLGYLLMAYYFPQVFETAGKRAETRGQDVLESLTELLGIEPRSIRLAIVDALDIPEYYRKIIEKTELPFTARAPKTAALKLVDALATADRISSAIITKKSREELITALAAISESSGFNTQQLNQVVHQLPALFNDHVKLIELSFLSLPDYISDFYVDKPEAAQKVAETAASTDLSSFSGQAGEIKQAIRNGEPISSIIASAMETIAFTLEFDRVILLMADKTRTELQGRMGLGKKLNFDPRSVRRSIKAQNISAPDIVAFTGGCPQIYGDPIFEDGWPFAAIPIGSRMQDAVGVIYADRVSSESSEASPLDSQAQASLSVLSDLLDQAVKANH